MNKKFLYVIGLVVVIILGVLFARVLSGSIDARPASSNKVENSNKLTNNQVKNETNNPKTGDNITTSIMLFVASIATIGTLTVVNRKK
jgi:LPXTG-motif cell wall-anchored protein